MATREEKIQLAEKLPQNLRDLFYSEDTGAFLSYIGKKYNLSDEKIGQISELVGDVILGILQAPSLQQKIEPEIISDHQTAANFVQELNSEFLLPALQATVETKPAQKTTPAPFAAPAENMPAPMPAALKTPAMTAPETMPIAKSTDKYREPVGSAIEPEIIDLRKTLAPKPATIPAPSSTPAPMAVPITKPTMPVPAAPKPAAPMAVEPKISAAATPKPVAPAPTRQVMPHPPAQNFPAPAAMPKPVMPPAVAAPKPAPFQSITKPAASAPFAQPSGAPAPKPAMPITPELPLIEAEPHKMPAQPTMAAPTAIPAVPAPEVPILEPMAAKPPAAASPLGSPIAFRPAEAASQPVANPPTEVFAPKPATVPPREDKYREAVEIKEFKPNPAPAPISGRDFSESPRPQYIMTPSGMPPAPNAAPRNVLDLRRDKGEF